MPRLQATAFQMQQQRDQEALHAAQQQAHFDLAAQLAASPEAAAIATAWERNPAAAAAALASTGPAFGAAGLLPGLAGMYAQPGAMDHYGAVHGVAAAAALQQNGWGNPGNIDGFSELPHAQQLAFAEAQLRAIARQFAAEQVTEPVASACPCAVSSVRNRECRWALMAPAAVPAVHLSHAPTMTVNSAHTYAKNPRMCI